MGGVVGMSVKREFFSALSGEETVDSSRLKQNHCMEAAAACLIDPSSRRLPPSCIPLKSSIPEEGILGKT